jgi:glycolate dehydrogenase FAD-linked subunit
VLDPGPLARRELDALGIEVSFVGSHAPSDLHDESLHRAEAEPFAVARPTDRDDVVDLVAWAGRHDLAITARGAGTGLSGGATPVRGGLVICFDRMDRIVEVDLANQTAVVEAGVTLRQLNEHLAPLGLLYPVAPGETSGTLGGNVNTNAGGMRAVRHGVTRNHVLALELVLADATVVRTGAPVVKSSSGYDLTQLVIGSEGTLALVTEATLRLTPRLDHRVTLLAPFDSVDAVTGAVTRVLRSALAPSILEYIDALTMSVMARETTFALALPPERVASAAAYLVVVLEARTARQLDEDLASTAHLLDVAGAADNYVLDGGAADELIAAREKAFWIAKAAGANDIVDVVVPRAHVARYVEEVGALAAAEGAIVSGCGHVGDGNVHLSVFQPDDAARERLLLELYRAGIALGGAISGEHGLVRDKAAAYLALTDPALVALQRRVKAAFDPEGRLNPQRHLAVGD